MSKRIEGRVPLVERNALVRIHVATVDERFDRRLGEDALFDVAEVEERVQVATSDHRVAHVFAIGGDLLGLRVADVQRAERRLEVQHVEPDERDPILASAAIAMRPPSRGSSGSGAPGGVYQLRFSACRICRTFPSG